MTWLSPEKAQYVLYFRKGRPYPHHNVVRIGNYPHHNVVRISYYPHHNVVRTRYYPHHTLIAKDTKEKFKRKVSGTLSLVKTMLKILTLLQILKVGAPKLLVFPRSLKVLDVIVSPCNCPALEAASKTLSIYCAWLMLSYYQILNSLEILVECDPPILSLRRL